MTPVNEDSSGENLRRGEWFKYATESGNDTPDEAISSFADELAKLQLYISPAGWLLLGSCVARLDERLCLLVLDQLF